MTITYPKWMRGLLMIGILFGFIAYTALESVHVLSEFYFSFIMAWTALAFAMYFQMHVKFIKSVFGITIIETEGKN